MDTRNDLSKKVIEKCFKQNEIQTECQKVYSLGKKTEAQKPSVTKTLHRRSLNKEGGPSYMLGSHHCLQCKNIIVDTCREGTFKKPIR